MKINTFIPDTHPYLRISSTLAKPPKTLYSLGLPPSKRVITVAIVGSRKPTPYGKEVTFDLAYTLAKKGVIIISGLAYGIDTAAHRGALEAGGTTLAILAHGLDMLYPESHRSLARQILKKGALISEYEAGVTPRPHYFLARNRLVSGLADAIIVTEAGERSGTLATVTYALEQGKEVFAVPGPITSPLSVGPNRLIQQGALPIVNADDVLAVIAPQLMRPSNTVSRGTPEEQAILSLLHQGIHSGEQLQIQSQLPMNTFSHTLTMLEISGQIRNIGGNEWHLRAS
jgi:DNA processing protein